MTKPTTTWACQKCGGLGKIIPRATPRSRVCAWCADELRKAGQRWCTKSRHGVALADWATPDSAMCRACQTQHNQAYHATHRDKAIAVSRAYYQANHAEMIARSRAYYQAHRAELLEQKRVYYQEKRELIKAKVRAHRPYRKPESIAREGARHRAKHQVYHHNAKVARARRFVQALRGAP